MNHEHSSFGDIVEPCNYKFFKIKRSKSKVTCCGGVCRDLILWCSFTWNQNKQSPCATFCKKRCRSGAHKAPFTLIKYALYKKMLR